MSLSRTNKQLYAILSDTTGNTVGLSGELLKISVVESATDACKDSTLVSLSDRVTNCDTDDVIITKVPVAGSHNNASNDVTTAGVDENSTSVDCQYVSKISAFGNVDGACTVRLFQSQDNVNFYNTGLEYVLASGGDFNLTLNSAPSRYYRLQYSESGVKVNSTIAGKN